MLIYDSDIAAMILCLVGVLVFFAKDGWVTYGHGRTDSSGFVIESDMKRNSKSLNGNKKRITGLLMIALAVIIFCSISLTSPALS